MRGDGHVRIIAARSPPIHYPRGNSVDRYVNLA